ncbi:MAG: ribosomal RNA small subunit methyltransferase A [Fimbriimonadaceae bacterium]|nr:MAG: ribosomal RNA small subunit methyltransferase A [Fimbriimonadaceae bacterium]
MHSKPKRSHAVGTTKSEGSHLHGSPHSGNGQEISLSDHLRAFGLKADKKFGQHWLTSSKVIVAILAKADGLAGVLEIGPGPGILTQGLAKQSKLVAIEHDERMIPAAQAYAQSAEIIFGDALLVDWSQILERLPKPVGIVSNMPYNITGPLLERVCQQANLIDRAVLMMQREVGDKILAKPGDRNRGALSVVMQATFDISIVSKVPPGCFSPPPKVDSIVLDFRPRSAPNQAALKLARQGFSQPRKTLLNNLSGVLAKEELTSRLADIGLHASIRPHELTYEHWVSLAEP